MTARRVTAVSLPAPSGHPWGRWPVASTHLDHRFDDSSARERQARRLLELAVQWRGDPATDLPVVIGADLNAVADSDEVRLLTGRRGTTGRDRVVRCLGTRRRGSGWTWRRENPYTNDSAWPNRRLDYVLVSWPRPKPVGNPVSARLVGTEPVDVEGEPVWASDHAAVVVDLVVAALRLVVHDVSGRRTPPVSSHSVDALHRGMPASARPRSGGQDQVVVAGTQQAGGSARTVVEQVGVAHRLNDDMRRPERGCRREASRD